MTDISNTSGRLHSEVVLLLFLQETDSRWQQVSRLSQQNRTSYVYLRKIDVSKCVWQQSPLSLDDFPPSTLLCHWKTHTVIHVPSKGVPHPDNTLKNTVRTTKIHYDHQETSSLVRELPEALVSHMLDTPGATATIRCSVSLLVILLQKNKKSRDPGGEMLTDSVYVAPGVLPETWVTL